MPSLGSFSFDVTADTSPAIRALAELQRQTAAFGRSLNGGSVSLNTSPAIGALNQLDAHSKASQTAASFTATPKVDTRQAQSALTSLSGTLKSALAFGAGAAGVNLGINAIRDVIGGVVGATREAERAQFALGKVYGDTSGQIVASTKAIADATGRGNTESQQAAIAIATLAKNYGATADEQAILLKRTADLAAIHGLSLPDAAKRAGDAMRGEAEASELLGVSLQSDALRATAQMTDAQRKQWETLDLVTKRQITLKEFLLQTSGAAGAATQNSNSFDAALTRLSGSASNFSVTLGKSTSGPLAQFISQVAGGIDRLNEFSKAIEENSRRNQEAAYRRARLEPPSPTPLIPTPSLETLGPLFGPTPEEVRAAQLVNADLVKAEEARLQALTVKRREGLAVIESAFQSEVTAAKANESVQKTAINEVRDAAIKAADARRDSMIAALDAEQNATSRARTLQDREIAASNDAILAGLEQVHNANLKGLDEQLTAIQKRGDVALKGIDDEIRGVDRKRDAALRALDDELRAEDRRHSEAIRNIDRERDAKLGIIDQQLAALDAAALRDQRRQTDQSLARNLAEAKRDLKEADTPEERRRAQQAVADAEASIRREALNRQREDARAALRIQADQIRAATDAAKELEAARNTTTKDSLSGQKTTVQDQAKAETERLNAIKDRIKVETDIEAQSIKDRVTAENEGYQQTVKDQQAAFKQQADALADQRFNEDTAIAGRRTAIQTAYANDTADAKTSADAQIADQEEITKRTLEEIAARKKAAELAVLPPVPIAPGTPAPGAPPRSAGPAISDDSTYGPFDSPGYTQDSTYGPFDPARYRDAANAVGTATADGLAMGISGPESVAAATAATDKLIKDAVIDEAKQLLGISSPSTVFAGFGNDTAQGFLDGYQQLDLAAPIRAPFEDSIVWLQGLPPIFLTSGGDTAGAWESGYEQYDLYAKGRKPFEDLDVWMSGLPGRMSASGTAAADAFGAGWTSRNPGTMIQGSLQTIVNNASGLQSQWGIVGNNFAVALIDGFNQAMAKYPLSIPGVESGSTAVQGSISGGTTTSATTTSGSTLRAGQYDVENYLLKYGLVPGTDDFNRYFDYYFAEQALGHSMPADMVITGHQFGGFAPSDRMAMFGERGMEFGLPPQAGSILPADVSRNLLAVASGQAVGGGNGGTSIQIGSMTIQVPEGTQDPRDYAQQVVMDIAHLIASTSTTRPGAPGTLIGA